MTNVKQGSDVYEPIQLLVAQVKDYQIRVESFFRKSVSGEKKGREIIVKTLIR